MNDRVEGTAREFGGRVQEGVGNLTGDTKTQAEGLYNQATGQAQQAATASSSRCRVLRGVHSLTTRWRMIQ